MTLGRGEKQPGTSEIVALPPDGDAQLGRALLHALRNAGISVLYQDRDLKTVWARNMPAPWAFGISGSERDSALPPTQADRVDAARRNVVATGNPERLEISIAGEDGMRWFEVWVDADRGEDGLVKGVVTTKVETTEQRQREQTLKALLREVSHRSKNLLAIIQSIASQTGRYSDSIGDFLTRFRGRLQSLASSQDLVTSSNWRGAQLRELVAGQVSRYGADPANSLHFEGVNPYLNPNAALHIGLAMHELAVNSVSYGALSRPGGFVEVTARRMIESDGQTGLSLVWREVVGANDRRRNNKRFGSVALERVVPTSLNGTATLDITGNRLEYRLLVPHGNFETD
jgi:two-component sensor histidine kinase